MDIRDMQKVGLLLVLLAGTSTMAADLPLTTVASVDLERYVGKWYEIARYANRFERKCISDVTATYSSLAGGKIRVVNACKDKDGKITEANGKAKIVDSKTNAKLKVTFFWPFYGDYWIVDLAPDYSYAVVSEPKREYLWVLAREPEMAPAAYEQILEKVRGLGLNPAKLVKTPHTKR
jgi:apolipoprotein D and lipocalin family protein